MRNNPASRKLYNDLAKELRRYWDNEVIVKSPKERDVFADVVGIVSGALARDNGRFDAERFWEAVYGRRDVRRRSQLRTRANPPSLVTFGNPAFCLSKNVVEIKYQHAGDGHYYRHEFRPKQVQIVVDGPGAKVAFLRRVDGKPLIEDY